MTATLTAGNLAIRASSPQASIPRSPRARAALRRTIYAPIDEHRTAADNSDIAAAWFAAGLVALALIATLVL